MVVHTPVCVLSAGGKTEIHAHHQVFVTSPTYGATTAVLKQFLDTYMQTSWRIQYIPLLSSQPTD